jgi:hypothetical protein
MANSGRVTTGNFPRLLQLGVNEIIDHYKKDYKGIGSEIFKVIQADKGFYEMVQLAGMGLAAVKGQGAAVELDSVDQDWVYRWTVVTYAKAARITMEAIQDNKYQDQIPILGQQIAEKMAITKDVLQAAVFNGLFATVGPDGQYYCDTDHPLQAGGTTSNTLSVSMSEDAIEQMVLKADNIKNPDGIESELVTMDLIVPQALRFEADRIVNSRYRTSSADNDISAIYNQNVIKRVLPWKRLSSTTSFFLTTNAQHGFMEAQRKGLTTDSFKEPTTFDVLVTAYERYINLLADFRAVVGNSA